MQVLVIGAGFGGLSAAKRLSGQGVEVTIVDRHNFHTFQPLLYQVATAGLDVSDVAYPVRTIFRKRRDVTFRYGDVRQVDLDARRVVLGDGSILRYDALIVATGATAGFFGIAGATEHSHPLYTLGDARKVRNLLLGCLEEAAAHPKLHGGGACIVVVGGGATGVETAGAVMELLDASRRSDSLELDWGRTKVVLLDSNDRLLSGFHEKAGAYPRSRHCGAAESTCGWVRRWSRCRKAACASVVTTTALSSAQIWSSGLEVSPSTGPSHRRFRCRRRRAEGSSSATTCHSTGTPR